MPDRTYPRQFVPTPSRIFLMRRLADGPEEDAVGLEMDEMTGHELQTADYLTSAKLAEIVPGWNMTFWYRLTPRGRKMLQVLSVIGF